MSKIIFYSRKYCRGEAWCNRLLAYAKGFKLHGADVQLIFLVSNEQSSISENDFGNLSVSYISSFNDNDNKFKKALIYLKALLCSFRYFNNGDIIFTSDGGGLFLPLLFFLRKKNYTFSEITEHPFVLGISPNLHGFRGVINKIIHRVKVFFHNKLIKYNTGIFTISDSLKKYYISHGINQDLICRVNMFVDVSRFEIERESGFPYIAYCGTISNSKDGVDILIKAFSIFHKTAPEYFLYIIGPYLNQSTKEQMESLISDLGINNYVVLTGKVNPIKMPKLLKNAKILALSRPDNLQNRNGFPTKLGEYLATGNPVVVTSVGEIPRFLIDGGNAYLAVPNDEKSFANALIKVYENYDKACSVGMNGKKLVMTDFSSVVQTKIALDFINKKIFRT